MKRRKRRAPEEARTVSRVCRCTPARTWNASRQSQPLEEMSRQRPSLNPKIAETFESRPLVSRAVTSCNGEQIRVEQTSQFTKALQRGVQQQCDELKQSLKRVNQPIHLRGNPADKVLESRPVEQLSRDCPTRALHMSLKKKKA